MVTDQKPTPATAEKKKGFTAYIVAIVLLVVAISVLAVIHLNQKKELKEVNAVLTEEKDSLTRELNSLIFGYDTLKTANESLSREMQVQQDKIRDLLALQASNATLIKKYKSELGTLREIMKSYIVQIDSLNTRNKLLTAENIEVRSQLRKAEETNVELSQKSEELSSKVEIASIILAKDIAAVPVNQRGKEVARISKISQLRVCFTLRENPIAPAGNRSVYIRIIRPDDIILATAAEDLFDFQGEKIVYSSKREVEYLNLDVEMCIYWDNNGQLIPGTYTVNLYTDGNMIGSTTFMLK